MSSFSFLDSNNEPAAQFGMAGGQWLVGGGEMGEVIRSKDWSTTPLGPLDNWPHSLRTTVSLGLSSNFPINIIWGSGYNQIYNDGYRVLCGERHPESMGMPYNECWASAWPAIGRPFERAWAGETSFLENQRMYLTRNGYLEETFFTFSLSPIRNEHGVIAGLFHPVTETTAKMLSERRTRSLRELAENTNEARSLENAFGLIVRTLAAHELDLPFVLLYSLREQGTAAHLVDSTGIEQGLKASPRLIPLCEDRVEDSAGNSAGSWPLAEILAGDSMTEIGDLQTRFGGLACGPYPEGANIALASAIRIAGVGEPLGVFIAGISPRLPFNPDYRNHLQQIATAVSTALSNALAYEQEKKRADALAELDRAKTQFFSNVSHEFRTPLTLMLGPIEDALAAPGTLPVHLREQLTVAHRNSLRLLRLVNALLDFSRIEAGRAKAVYEPTNLGTLTAELASNFRSAIDRAGLQLSVDCPPLDEPVYIDREMWEKIVLNLLSNAFKFTLEGGISVRLQRTGQQVELTVSDTGIGIPEDELPHIFERFHRVRSAQGRTHEGTGIGLALVQELVKLHGGTMAVNSTLGKGATFSVRVPLGAAHLSREQLGASRELASTAVRAEAFVEEALRWLPEEHLHEPVEPLNAEAALATSASGEFTQAKAGEPIERVLVVDDNADMRDYLRRLLAGRYDVRTAANGEEALKLALAESPSLVLADIMMPGLDGFSLLQALRSNQATTTIPVILLSARAGEEARSEGMNAGADDYLVKPFSARELLARVGAHLKLARTRNVGEEMLRESEERLAAELSGAKALQAISTKLIPEQNAEALYSQILQAATQLMKSDAASIQMFDPASNELKLLAWKNFHPDSATFWQCVRAGSGSSCGRVLATNKRVVVPDIECCDFMAGTQDLDEYRRSGLRAVQSTPLVSRSGRPLGMISTHWRKTHRPADHDFDFFDVLARQASDLLERSQTELLLRESEERQVFLLKLSDALRPLADPIEIQDVAARLLGERLRTDRAYYAEIDEAQSYILVARDFVREGVPSMAGRYPLADFDWIGPAFRMGRQTIVADSGTSPLIPEAQRQAVAAIRVGAFIAVPLIKAGRLVAALCVTDLPARTWTPNEVQLVAETAERTWAAVGRARAEAAARDSEERFRLFVENVHEYALVQTSPEGRITGWNPGAERLFGYTMDEAIGKPFSQLTQPDGDKAQALDREIAEASDGQKREDAQWLTRKGGAHFWARWVSEPVYDASGKLRGIAKLMRDETDRQRAEKTIRSSLAEKEQLLKEVHHRVKNNLQVITSLLNMQAHQIDNAEVLAQFDEARNRVFSIAAIHELLYSSASFSAIDLAGYARRLAPDLVRFYNVQDRIQIAVCGDGMTLELERAMPYGLLLNEVVSNACKHAFPRPRTGSIMVSFERKDGNIELTVADNGRGLPDGFDYRRSSSLGLKLVRSLATQLRGSVEVQSGSGTTVRVRFPEEGGVHNA